MAGDKRAPMRRAVHAADWKTDARRLRAVLEPHEWQVAWRRIEGWTYREIGQSLGICRSAGAMRMARARRRIARLRPDLLPLLEPARRRPGGR